MGYINKEDLTFRTKLEHSDTRVHTGATLDASDFHERSCVQTEFKMSPTSKHDNEFYDMLDASCIVVWELRVELREWGVKCLGPEVVDVEVEFEVRDWNETEPTHTLTINTEHEKGWTFTTIWASDNEMDNDQIQIQPTELEVDIEKKNITITF